MRKSFALWLCAALCLLCAPALAKTSISMEAYENMAGTYSVSGDVPTYADYLAACPDETSEAEIAVEGASFARYEEDGAAVLPEILADYAGMAGQSVLTRENALIEYDVEIPESGLYQIEATYYSYPGKGSAIQRAFYVDGALPYGEMALVQFSRLWVNGESAEYVDANGVTRRAWKKDNQSNDLKPSPKEQPDWQTAPLRDANGYITAPMCVYLTKGAHTITILSLREPMLLRGLTLKGRVPAKTYAETRAELDATGAKETSGVCVRVEAENAKRTSSQMLYPTQDQSSPAVYPSSTRLLLNNVIGGNAWRRAGQWIEWAFAVPEDGYYQISLYDKQNIVRGIHVSRRVSIDGVVPFFELERYGFAYSQSWRLETLSDADGAPYEIYLTAGEHTLRMEVTLGTMAPVISGMQTCVQKLNAIYRKVICITGVAPDKYRDYQIEASLPGLRDELIDVQGDLQAAIDALKITAGENTDKLTVLRTMYDQLGELIFDQERFTEVITSYKINVRACGNWITQVLVQPLTIDRLYIHSADVKPEVSASGFLSGLGYEIGRLYHSFVINYNQIGNVSDKGGDAAVITLWIGTGRDQANVIKSLIDERFTAETGVNVNVQLVDMNTLLRATLSGQGPDVAIQVASTNSIAGAVLDTGNDTPVNYGLRHAVLDLSQFSDFDEVAARFPKSALTGFSFGGAAYALPDTLTFPMIFYRKDILAQIGLDVPKTWEDVKVAMSVLSKNQMEFGMLPSEQIFAMLLYQNGGQYYTENGDRSLLDSDIAVSTFKQYCEYYSDYKLDKATSVEERFRTGECPLIIANYTLYNNLQVSAPDIQGLWGFTSVPGTLRADGTIDATVSGTGLADIIMADTEYPEESWLFLKWWTSAETQTLYGREMESLMGESARVATANLEALSLLSWPIRDYEALTAQLAQTRGIPQVPGGYYSWRNVNNAFFTVAEDAANKVVNSLSATPREELMDKVYYINAEITYKRQEFGLPVAGEDQ